METQKKKICLDDVEKKKSYTKKVCRESYEGDFFCKIVLNKKNINIKYIAIICYQWLPKKLF
jgi:hypothetical protein